MLEQLRAQIRAKLEERAAAKKAADETLAGPTAEQRDLNDEEAKAFAEARDKVKALDAELDGLDARVKELEAADAADAEANRRAQTYGGDRPTDIRVGNEPTTYRKGGQHSFFADAINMRRGFRGAAERIERHMGEMRALGHADRDDERRDATTDSFGSLVVPQYLVDDFAPVARAGRPFANSIGTRPLPPEGMTVTIPLGTTGTLAAAQTTQNTAVSEQDYGVTDLVVPVRTVAAQSDMSRQARDRGRMDDQVVMEDLAAEYATRLDDRLLNGTGANGQHLGVLSMTTLGTITVTSSNVLTQYKQIADAIQRINSGRYLPATAIWMHPRRWGAFTAATDSNGRPLLPSMSQVPQNVFGVGEAAQYGQVVGHVLNVPIVTDANIPTTVSSSTVSGSTEDKIIVARASDLRLWEESVTPNQLEFEETLAGNLTIKLVTFGYSAFTAARYTTATYVLTGSGLTTPTFA